MNILLTNIGRRTYIVDYMLQLIPKYGFKLFVCDTSDNVAGFHVASQVQTFITPRVRDNEDVYVEILLKQCKEHNINFIIPLMDFELPVLALNKQLFLQNDIRVVVSDFKQIDNCLDKKKNFEFFKNTNIKIPCIYSSKDEIIKFPVIAKKILGSGSVGLSIVYDKNTLTHFDETYLFQEYINGIEFGMDILNDFEGNYIHSTCRKKLLMRAGETDKAEFLYDTKYEELARQISNYLKHVGNLDLDFLVDENNEIYFIDFNPRFGGGYPVTHEMGFNYLEYLIQLHLKQTITIPNIDLNENVTIYKGIQVLSNKNYKG